MNTALLKYPNKSHRKVITIPKESNELAELMGIIAGDGGINNNWQLVISLNSVVDQEYSIYVANLIKKLFSINVAIRKRPNENTLVIVATSMTLVDFVVEKGAIRGNKILGGLTIPNWIKNNKDFQKYFVRGLIDTDGCIYIHKHIVGGHLYRNIGLNFCDFSVPTTKAVSKILDIYKIKHSLTKNNTSIYLYSQVSVLKYLDIFGSSNPRIYNKVSEWRGRIVV